MRRSPPCGRLASHNLVSVASRRDKGWGFGAADATPARVRRVLRPGSAGCTHCAPVARSDSVSSAAGVAAGNAAGELHSAAEVDGFGRRLPPGIAHSFFAPTETGRFGDPLAPKSKQPVRAGGASGAAASTPRTARRRMSSACRSSFRSPM